MKITTHHSPITRRPPAIRKPLSLGERLRLTWVACAGALLAAALPVEAQISNGGFESGTLSGWSTLDSPEPETPQWLIYSGTTRPITITTNPEVNTVPAPVEGTNAVAAVSPDFGYGYSILYRDITLAAGQTHTLKFSVAYHNWLAEQQPGNPNIWLRDPDLTRDPDDFANQQFRVDIISPSAALGTTADGPTDVLKSILRGQNPGDPNPDGAGISVGSIPYTEKTVDLTPYAGQTVRLRFAVSQSLFYIDAFVDNVRLTSTGPVVNQPPTAVPGPNSNIHPGTLATLNGSGSFDDNTPSASLSYAWSFFSAPAGNTAVLNNANTATPSFTPNVLGDYILQLIVTDTGMPPLSSAPAYITLSSFNLAPTAVATASPVLPLVGQTVSLDSTGSSDPENDALTYLWTITMRPAGSVAPLMNATSSVASITPDVAGTYKATLTVSDFLGAGTPVSVTFTASLGIGFVEDQLRCACALVEALPGNQVSSKGNQKEFCKILKKALKHIQHGRYCKASSELDKAIIRTDGVPLRGTPDHSGNQRDWILNASTQVSVYNKLIAAKNALAGLADCDDGDDDDDDE